MRKKQETPVANTELQQFLKNGYDYVWWSGTGGFTVVGRELFLKIY